MVGEDARSWQPGDLDPIGPVGRDPEVIVLVAIVAEQVRIEDLQIP
jgi:hypothetical protein